ncbi:MAG: MBL fold metallo-hydrolase [Planctomycetes bacterium]|nr:MBL fold metallo-hydrolase [Planctomycetota bacterium]MCW8136711.1 MBL fold metallo-hydrolase [Planctomycetota bacterium]
MARTLYILGSGQDGGLPQLGARIAADMHARVDPLAVRLGPSVCVLDDDGRCLLIDVSPDIKEQESRLLQVPAYAARPAGNPFDAVLLTHAHMGHYVGLAHFGREAANTRELPVYCTAKMDDFLRRNAPWDQLVALGNIALLPAATMHPWPGLSIRTIPVPHRGEYTDTVGVSINNDILYVPDIDDWRQWPAAREEVARHRVCLLDATFYSRDELPGRDLKEISHPFIEDTLAFFADEAKSRRIILTHFNHSNPVCDPTSPQAGRVLDAGFELAQEMTAIAL